MARKAKKDQIFAPLDPLWKYPEMMSVQDVAEFAGIGATCATTFVQRNGGVKVIEGAKRSVWRIHKEYVRKAFNLPQAIA